MMNVNEDVFVICYNIIIIIIFGLGKLYYHDIGFKNGERGEESLVVVGGSDKFTFRKR